MRSYIPFPRLRLTILVLVFLCFALPTLAQEQSTDTTNTTEAETVTHTVTYGDSLYRIALRYGTTVQHLMQINNLTNAHWIYAGQQLHLG